MHLYGNNPFRGDTASDGEVGLAFASCGLMITTAAEGFAVTPIGWGLTCFMDYETL